MKNALTVGQLVDVVSSQLCIYGNKAIFLKADIEHNKSFLLFSGAGTDNQILECVNYGDQCPDDGGLTSLLERLNELDESEVIYCSDDEQIKRGFTLGFKSSDDGFIETINSSELIQPTFF